MRTGNFKRGMFTINLNFPSLNRRFGKMKRFKVEYSIKIQDKSNNEIICNKTDCFDTECINDLFCANEMQENLNKDVINSNKGSIYKLFLKKYQEDFNEFD